MLIRQPFLFSFQIKLIKGKSMKKLKRMLTAVLALSFVLFVSCATTSTGTKTAKQKATLEKTSERMLWKISGTDKNGNPSAIYVQGTIHVGDERLVISDNVKKLFLSADRRIGEISSADYPKIEAKTAEMMIEGAKAAALENKDFRNDLSEEHNEMLRSLMQEESTTQYAMFEPWVLNLVLSMTAIGDAGLDPTRALDSYFIDYAQENSLSTEGLDSLETQLDIVKFGSWNDQVEMLAETIDSLGSVEKREEAAQEIIDMYEAYIDDDVDKLSKVIDKSQIAETAIEKRYNKLLWQDRNVAWAKLFAEYLNEGGTTFVFAGCGHFTGKNSVFNEMQKNKTLTITK